LKLKFAHSSVPMFSLASTSVPFRPTIQYGVNAKFSTNSDEMDYNMAFTVCTKMSDYMISFISDVILVCVITTGNNL
jgi:hypothetical protein